MNKFIRPYLTKNQVLIGIWMAVASITAFIIFDIVNSRYLVLQHAIFQVTSYARLVSEHAVAVFDRTNSILSHATDSLTVDDLVNPRMLSEKRRLAIQNKLISLQNGAFGIVSMSITDADGYVFANTVGRNPGDNLGDRSYFLKLKSVNVDQPVISEAIKGRLSNKWGLQMARRINLPDGQFAGMVVANLSISGFVDFYRELGLRDGVSVIIKDSSDRLLARYPVLDDKYGMNLPIPPDVVLLDRGNGEIIYHRAALTDNVVRLYAYKPLPRYGISATVGMPDNLYLNAWHRLIFRDIFLLIVVVAGGVIVTLGVRRLSRDELMLREAHEQLKDHQQRLDFVLEGSELGFWDWNLVTGNVQRNARWAEMLGYHLEDIEFTVKQWVDFIHPDDRIYAQQSIEDHLKGVALKHKAIYRMRAKDGEYRWILDQAKVVARSPDGKPLRMSGTHTDVTDQKILEEELNKAKKLLETELANKESSLQDLQNAQRQLVQAEKMASLGTLVAGVAHEINTPLGVALMCASHIIDETKKLTESFSGKQLKKSDLAQYIGVCDEASHTLLDNVQKSCSLIQSFKQLAYDQVTDEHRVVEIGKLLSDVALNLSPVWRKAGHSVAVICDTPIQVDSYPGALSQIFTNLIINSIDHAFDPDETGHITISAARVHRNVQIIYQDDGRGIPKDVSEKVFDPFFTTKRSSGNTGLGMHIIYNIVTGKLGGQIKLHDDTGRGVMISITFPVRDIITQGIMQEGSDDREGDDRAAT